MILPSVLTSGWAPVSIRLVSSLLTLTTHSVLTDSDDSKTFVREDGLLPAVASRPVRTAVANFLGASDELGPLSGRVLDAVCDDDPTHCASSGLGYAFTAGAGQVVAEEKQGCPEEGKEGNDSERTDCLSLSYLELGEEIRSQYCSIGPRSPRTSTPATCRARERQVISLLFFRQTNDRRATCRVMAQDVTPCRRGSEHTTRVPCVISAWKNSGTVMKIYRRQVT